MDNSSRLMFAVVMVIAYMAMRGQTQNSTTAQNATNTANTTTTGPNTTMTLTTVAPIVNNTVTPLTGNILRAECGKSQFCAAVPDNCDPSVAGSCFFVSTKQSSGQTFSFQLRGVSSGYIAVGLSTDSIQGGNDTTYVCANNNSIVQFFTTLFDKGVLTDTNTVRILGSPTAVLFSSKGVDLGNPNATVTNSLNANTTAGNATTTAAPSSHAFVLQHTLSQDLNQVREALLRVPIQDHLTIFRQDQPEVGSARVQGYVNYEETEDR
ncbi:unnamed protein product [Coregonus sp. 'balchen']|nr:unnamed protein product [Coregonus sp. 'balchen']